MARLASTILVRSVPQVTETIVEYDEAGRTLTYEATAGLPAFVTLARNTWRVTSLGDGQSRVSYPTRTDHSVPFAHALSLASTIRHTELVESLAYSHFVWLGPDWPAIAKHIQAFLDTHPPALSNHHTRV